MFHERYQEMLEPYALSTLDQEDARTLEEHLATCGDCCRELEDWKVTATVLAFSAAPVEPSPQVRARILESVRAQSSERTTARGFNDRREARSTVRPATQIKRLWSSTQKFGAIAAALTFIALIISILVLWKHDRTAQAELAKSSAERVAAQQELERQRELVELLSTRGASLAVLSGTAQAPDAHATLTYDQRTGRAVLLTDGLPPAPAGKAYQLWFIVGNLPIPGKVFAIGPTGKAILSDQVPSQALKVVVFAVTLEPESGVKTPTGPIYLRSAS